MLWGGPAVCVTLVLAAFGNEIGATLHGLFGGTADDQAKFVMYTFCGLFLVYNVANMFIATTFYYLFNDVVPENKRLSFFSYFRVVSQLAQMFYGFYIFGYSNTSGPAHFLFVSIDHVWYPQIVLLATAAGYLLLSTLALLNIKEPEHPPPAPLSDRDSFTSRMVGTLRAIRQDCFGHRIYILFFLFSTLYALTGLWADFNDFAVINQGLTLEQVGKIGSIASGAGLVLTILVGSWADRFSPMKVMLLALVMLVITLPIGFFSLTPDQSPDWYLKWIIVGAVVSTPVGVIVQLAEWPIYMVVLPKSHFGQFSAANAMMRTICVAGLAYPAGLLMETMVKAQGDFAYRYCFLWGWILHILSLVAFIFLYREWKRLGGREGYVPPTPQSELIAPSTSPTTGAPS
jgi:MFS family permease